VRRLRPLKSPDGVDAVDSPMSPALKAASTPGGVDPCPPLPDEATESVVDVDVFVCLAGTPSLPTELDGTLNSTSSGTIAGKAVENQRG